MKPLAGEKVALHFIFSSDRLQFSQHNLFIHKPRLVKGSSKVKFEKFSQLFKMSPVHEPPLQNAVFEELKRTILER